MDGSPVGNQTAGKADSEGLGVRASIQYGIIAGKAESKGLSVRAPVADSRFKHDLQQQRARPMPMKRVAQLRRMASPPDGIHKAELEDPGGLHATHHDAACGCTCAAADPMRSFSDTVLQHYYQTASAVLVVETLIATLGNSSWDVDAEDPSMAFFVFASMSFYLAVATMSFCIVTMFLVSPLIYTVVMVERYLTWMGLLLSLSLASAVTAFTVAGCSQTTEEVVAWTIPAIGIIIIVSVILLGYCCLPYSTEQDCVLEVGTNAAMAESRLQLARELYGCCRVNTPEAEARDAKMGQLVDKAKLAAKCANALHRCLVFEEQVERRGHTSTRGLRRKLARSGSNLRREAQGCADIALHYLAEAAVYSASNADSQRS
ncbi:hypothetical protein JKP88DRAFT_293832 [Tribonema minus]|uniref:Uncharacterized protein n=1 Tax=Tribonema minus TaxID=303371 RepID=A0A836CMR9_9STRA|nr:hypothetical protein JKP88DRAFT_293832 [Tribonema minus]